MRALYHRSGWTQDELAKVEGKKQPYIAQKLVFGRFLGFIATGNIPNNLTERRFRSYWEQTEKNPNERVRSITPSQRAWWWELNHPKAENGGDRKSTHRVSFPKGKTDPPLPAGITQKTGAPRARGRHIKRLTPP